MDEWSGNPGLPNAWFPNAPETLTAEQLPAPLLGRVNERKVFLISLSPPAADRRPVSSVRLGAALATAGPAAAGAPDQTWNCRASAAYVAIPARDRVEPVVANGSSKTATESPDRARCADDAGSPADTASDLGLKGPAAETTVNPDRGLAVDQSVTAKSSVADFAPGAQGKDKLFGGAGRDKLDGGPGRDIINSQRPRQGQRRQGQRRDQRSRPPPPPRMSSAARARTSSVTTTTNAAASRAASAATRSSKTPKTRS